MKRLLATLAALLPLGATLPAQPATAAPSPGGATPVQTVITSGYCEVWTKDAGANSETYAIFKDNVVVTGTNLRITCDRIDATLAGKNDLSPTAAKTGTADDIERFKTIIATGKVRIVQGDREANAERAEVFPREGKIILTGPPQPVAIDHGSGVTWVGEPMTLLKNERRVIVPNSRIILPPIKDLGFDKNAPLPKSETDAAPSK